MNAPSESRARILFAHGSRDPLWKGPIEAVARRLADLAPGLPVACAYLELMTPDLASCVDAYIAQGRTELEIVPLFFGTGRHLREDLPVLVNEVRVRHPGVNITLRPALGEDPAIIDLIARHLLTAGH